MASSPTAVDYAQLSGVTGIDQTSTGHYTSPTSYTFGGHAAGSAGATDVKSVEIYDGTKDLGAATVTAATGAWTYSATGLADGTHTFGAVVTDNEGDESALASSKTVADMVDHAGPVGSITSQNGIEHRNPVADGPDYWDRQRPRLGRPVGGNLGWRDRSGPRIV